MKEKKPRLIFHTFFTYVCLPLSIILGVLYTLGNFENIFRIPGIEKPFSFVSTNMNGTTFPLLFILIFPTILTILSLVSFPGLIKRKPFGRVWIIIKEAFSFLYYAYFSTPLILKLLKIENVNLIGLEDKTSLLGGIISIALTIFSIFCFIYYIKVKRFFRKEKNVVLNEEKEQSEEVKEGNLFEDIEEEKKEDNASLFSFGEEDLTEKLYEEKEEKKEEELPSVEMKRESVKENEINKILHIIPATFNPSSPLVVKDIVLKEIKGKTLLEFSVLNRSEKDYIEATWLLNGEVRFVSSISFLSGSVNLLTTTLDKELDGMSIKNESVKDENNFLSTFDTSLNNNVPFAEKIEIESLIKNNSFPRFVKEYNTSHLVDAKYIYSKNLNGSAYTCPVCGEAILKDENRCLVCGNEKDAMEAFTKENILTSFEKYLKDTTLDQ